MSSISKVKSSPDLAILEKFRSFAFINDDFEKESFSTALKNVLVTKFYSFENLSFLCYVIDIISKFPKNLVFFKNSLIEKCHVVIKSENDKPDGKSLIALDRALGYLRENHNFLLRRNKTLFEKWKSYGFKEALFYKYPEFSQFLLDSSLASQIKVTKDEIQEIANEPAILIEGKWTRFSDLKKRFDYKFSPKFKETFLYDKQSDEVFTYLDTKKGLVKHHPYLNALDPVGKISSSEYQAILKKSHQFERDFDKPKRNYKYILQIVTSKMPPGKSSLSKSNLFDFLLRPRHPYFRLIDPDTKNVHIIGYGFWNWKDKMGFFGPLVTDQGRFRSPDIWEYRNCSKRIVTNIPLNKEEMKRFTYFCKKFVNDDINFGKNLAFNFMNHNCTSFVKEAVKYSFSKQIITNASLDEIICEISPNILRKLAVFLKSSVVSIKEKFISFFPDFVKKVDSFLFALIDKIKNVVIAFFVSFLASFLGGIRGKNGRKIKDPEKEEVISPPLLSPVNWFRYSLFKFDLPGKIQIWQMKQKSTFVCDNPLKLTISP
ncbi:MAG: hypothetical protein JXA94_02600 [Parachlamydiales bacterium]|nr:hypothetical protein [Parachlamydiales bacterium]